MKSSKPRRNALGRGLESLISITDIEPGGSSAINEIEVSRIAPNPEQPRTDFDEASLEELATSIRELGVIQPLTLRQTDDGTYQIIAGERRWRAATKAGLQTVPAYVRTASDSEVTEMALIENIQRENLNAVEVALAFQKLIDTYKMTQERLSERIGKNRATIANHLRLLRLPGEIQIGLRDRKLDMGHARALLSIADPKQQLKLYKRILKEGLSVRRVEELAREIDAEPAHAPAKPTDKKKEQDYGFFSKQLAEYFPTPVKFKRSDNGKGSITLSFANDDELQQLVNIFEKLGKTK